MQLTPIRNLTGHADAVAALKLRVAPSFLDEARGLCDLAAEYVTRGEFVMADELIAGARTHFASAEAILAR